MSFTMLADGSDFDAGAGSSTLSIGGVLIGISPLNAALSGLGGSSLNAGFAPGTTALSQSGYGNALGQYGADRLSFAFSQGDYTASGATPQTFLQNQLNAPSSLSQFSAINQTIFNTFNLSNNLFVTGTHQTDIFSAGYPFGSGGFGTVGGGFGALSPFSPSGVPVNTVGALDARLINDGLTGTSGLNPTETATGVGAIGSGVAETLGTAHSSTGFGTPGLDTASFLNPGTTASSVTAAPGDTSLGDDGQAGHGVTQAAHGVTTVNAVFAQEQFTIKTLNADPFAHYNDLIQGHHGAQATGVELQADSALDAVKLAAAIGNDHLIFTDHGAPLLASHSSQAGDIHSDDGNHAVPHIADTGGHLL